MAAAPPLLLHLAAQTPAPRASENDAGLEASSPSPPPPRIPGAAASRGRGGAVTEPRRAPPPPPDTQARRPACAVHPHRCCSAARPPSSAPREVPQPRGSAVPGVPAPWGSLQLPGRRASGPGTEEEKGGGTDGTQRPSGGLASQGGTPWNGRGGGPTLPRRRVCRPPWRLARPAAHRPALRVQEGARLGPLRAAANTFSPRLTGGGVQFGT